MIGAVERLDVTTAADQRRRLRLDRSVADWIWRVKGSVPLAPGLPGDEAFDRLGSLFRERGTTYERSGDTLSFRKVDPDAQDKMSVFDDGVLRIEQQATGRVLRYALTSRALLFCFLAPLLFIGIAQLTVYWGKHHQPPAATKSDAAAKKAAAKDAPVPMNRLDKLLGAPAPEKKDAHKDKDEGKKKPSPTPAYVFAGIFAALYLIGRVLEDRLVRRLFQRRLAGV